MANEDKGGGRGGRWSRCCRGWDLRRGLKWGSKVLGWGREVGDVSGRERVYIVTMEEDTRECVYKMTWLECVIRKGGGGGDKQVYSELPSDTYTVWHDNCVYCKQ